MTLPTAYRLLFTVYFLLPTTYSLNAPVDGLQTFADKVSVRLTEMLAAEESAVC